MNIESKSEGSKLRENARSQKYLTFNIANEDYGISITTVKEIIGMMKITNIPKTPVFIKGVINLRGKIIPIMDLRLKFGLAERAYNERTCIIVVEIHSDAGKRNIGIIVDTVSEVININSDDVEQMQSEDIKNDGDFINGIGKVKDKVVMLLETEKIISKDELKTISNIKEGV